MTPEVQAVASPSPAKRVCKHCKRDAEFYGPVGMWQHCPEHEGGSLQHEWEEAPVEPEVARPPREVGDRAAEMFDFLEIATASQKQVERLQGILNGIIRVMATVDEGAWRVPSEGLPEMLSKLLAPPQPDPAPPQNLCGLCGKSMPKGEEMFTFHGYSGPCPAPSLSEGSPKATEPPCPIQRPQGGSVTRGASRWP